MELYSFSYFLSKRSKLQFFRIEKKTNFFITLILKNTLLSKNRPIFCRISWQFRWVVQAKIKMLVHIVRNSIWLKKNRASDNEGKFHSFLMCRIWIYSQTLISQLDIRVRVHLAHFWKIRLFLSAPVQAASSCCQCWSAWKEPKIA